MSLPELLRRVRFLLRRERMTADLADEMRLHLELRAAQHRAAGMAAEEAERAARRGFGNRAALQDAARDAWGLAWADAIRHDLRGAARNLVRSPGLALAAVVTLALGIGVNTAMFSLLDRLFLRPPAGVVRPETVYRLYLDEPLPTGERYTSAEVDYPELVDLQAGTRDVAALTAYATDSLRFGDAPDAPVVPVAVVGPGYFELLGAPPARGRAFTAAESRIDVPVPIAVVSDAFWRHRLGGGDVLGRTIELGGRRFTVVGIAPPGFTGTELSRVDVWLPLGNLRMPVFGERPWYRLRSDRLLRVLARPRDGVTPEALAVHATAAYRRGPEIGGATPDPEAVITTGPLAGAAGPGGPEREVALSERLAGVSLIVLLVACANVANLLLVHAVRRRREIAVRLALGVSRRRLAALLLAESALLALAGGTAALAVGYWCATALRALLLPGVRWAEGPLDWRVAAFTLLVALAVATLTGLAPLVQARSLRLRDALKPGEHGATARRSRLQQSLVVAQAALVVLLLAGAGLFVDSLRRITAVDLGYDAERLVFGSVVFRDASGREETTGHGAELAAGLRETARRLEAAPEVEGVALATHAPMSGYSSVSMELPGRDSVPRVGGREPAVLTVSPGYFGVTGVQLRRGRLFDAGDARGDSRALVVNETTARTFWPGEDPLGQCIHLPRSDASCRTVVGVVADAHRGTVIEGPVTQIYRPLREATLERRSLLTIVVRARAGQDAAVAGLLRRALHETMPPSADVHVRTMAERLAPEFRVWRLGATLFSAFGLLALLVAAVGIYGVVAYETQRRTHELGVRAALGARAGDLLRLVTGQGVRTVGVGVVLGVLLTLAGGRLIASLLYETSPRDPRILLGVAAVLLLVAATAAAIPAWRATRASPLEALRTE
ncbi:MAG TPA: ADOP family duplicated permease [Gemmatimonadaceae bacterium]|nr:ADOP family duplicated permease [Gemmatimonadaceae bacterium]